MEFEPTVDAVGKSMDLVGVALLVLGVAWALIVLVIRRNEPDVYRDARRTMGKGILLGLEVLVAADIIRTVAISPTFTSVGVLAGIVLIRTFLSLTLELEIDGTLPWRKREAEESSRARE